MNFRIIDIYSLFKKHGHKHISTNKLINQFSLQFSMTTFFSTDKNWRESWTIGGNNCTYN